MLKEVEGEMVGDSMKARLTMYNSIVNVVHMEELFANYGKKKQPVKMNTVPDFKDAIQNPEEAMAQVLAMSAKHKTVGRFDHGYDAHSSKPLSPW
ncbi:hypothetical protein GUITHDRAFT_109045 [Guillardia theta CCMP2712]|uniref:Uncharacterized protein n=1 Tax=Guillardia theta (strain CCMP2712) TaxID=905079 RepID=L1JA85_GUITC|nr:hypothetical protein GUITHDRAFT_109045 [Guillardia theta CCMP2712]EKX45000.1 hypothetical protein GUITHDRAFT_109045 [Guillardia theta CCMP2712]|eukprot:XP_005831980.1 hypothetical protein GUITHDRAFT_109045 [Guillardia theta CCMP2712]